MKPIHPKCMECLHWLINAITTIPICDAFLEGIPEEIFYNNADHTIPFPGDNGIRFEPIEDFNNSNKRLK